MEPTTYTYSESADVVNSYVYRALYSTDQPERCLSGWTAGKRISKIVLHPIVTTERSAHHESFQVRRAEVYQNSGYQEKDEMIMMLFLHREFIEGEEASGWLGWRVQYGYSKAVATEDEWDFWQNI